MATDEAQESIRAAAVRPHRQCGRADRRSGGSASPAEAQLLLRADAQSGGALCTDAFRPVVFKLERIEAA